MASVVGWLTYLYTWLSQPDLEGVFTEPGVDGFSAVGSTELSSKDFAVGQHQWGAVSRKGLGLPHHNFQDLVC
ncbi:hypothetical protein [Acaryochloris marina]|uniref:hypothetical protein n=1 Tax=Acaryochloris marina TaxID=155978 RepID=UPI001BB01409|nr:hypothetical protein [Acaryochloris marina]QUY42118.1 hypothetical protein I1H34_23385 [Acaryochloris marina S15]